MKATQLLHNLGQSIWLDNITRDLLDSGTLKHYIDELSVTGLTSNPTIFDHAIKNSTAYDAAIREILIQGESGEALFFESGAGGHYPGRRHCSGPFMTRPMAWTVGCRSKCRPCWPMTPPARWRRPRICTRGRDSRTCSSRSPEPRRACRPSKKRSLPASRSTSPSCSPASNTWRLPKLSLRGIERRIEAGLKPDVGSVASIFISRWDAAVMGKVAESLRDQLGIAIAKRTYKAYRDLLDSPRWQRVFNAGARPQRLLWASTGTKDPKASDVLYIKALAAPFTVNTMPEGTLKALADHGELGTILPADGGDCEEVLAQFAKAGIDVDALAAQLQEEGAKSFVKSWNELMEVIVSKSSALKTVRCRLKTKARLASKARAAHVQDDSGRKEHNDGRTRSNALRQPKVSQALTKRKAWKALQAHYKKVRELHLRNLFADDPQRGERMTAEAVGLFLDYSKNRITDETLKLLIGLAEESGLQSRIDAMFRGEKINVTEKRAVLHVALRAPQGSIHRRRRRERRAPGPRRAR